MEGGTPNPGDAVASLSSDSERTISASFGDIPKYGRGEELEVDSKQAIPPQQQGGNSSDSERTLSAPIGEVTKHVHLDVSEVDSATTLSLGKKDASTDVDEIDVNTPDLAKVAPHEKERASRSDVPCRRKVVKRASEDRSGSNQQVLVGQQQEGNSSDNEKTLSAPIEEVTNHGHLDVSEVDSATTLSLGKKDASTDVDEIDVNIPDLAKVAPHKKERASRSNVPCRRKVAERAPKDRSGSNQQVLVGQQQEGNSSDSERTLRYPIEEVTKHGHLDVSEVDSTTTLSLGKKDASTNVHEIDVSTPTLAKVAPLEKERASEPNVPCRRKVVKRALEDKSGSNQQVLVGQLQEGNSSDSERTLSYPIEEVTKHGHLDVSEVDSATTLSLGKKDASTNVHEIDVSTPTLAKVAPLEKERASKPNVPCRRKVVKRALEDKSGSNQQVLVGQQQEGNFSDSERTLSYPIEEVTKHGHLDVSEVDSATTLSLGKKDASTNVHEIDVSTPTLAKVAPQEKERASRPNVSCRRKVVKRALEDKSGSNQQRNPLIPVWKVPITPREEGQGHQVQVLIHKRRHGPKFK
ncbi:hypothetical protein ACP70R_016476 [Stipagrostis hirtigluma subsp. patula]